MKITEWLRRVWYLLNRSRLEHALRQEMKAHRELMGDPRKFGNTLRLREESRDVWGWTWLDDLWRDVRFGFRTLRHSVGFSLGAFLILSLGIGINLANFQLIDILFWSPPKLREPATLVRFDWMSRRNGGNKVPYPLTQFVTSNNNVLSAVLVRVDASDVGGVMWGDTGDPELRSSFVSANWFNEVDFRPLLGRVFQPGIDDAPDAAPVVVVSRGFWENRLNGNPDVIGKGVKINNRPATVVGIVPGNIVPQHDSAIWMPVSQIDYFVPGSPLKTSWDFQVSRAELYARLKPGISLSTAREASKALMDELAKQHPEQIQPNSWLEPLSAVTKFMTPSRSRRDALYFIPIAGALTLLILLIACANLSNLILSRTVSRVRELAIRSALGANRWRVLRQLLSESAVLVVIGSVGGLVLVYWMARMTTVFWEFAPDFTPDLRTVFAGLLVGGFTVAVIGLLPAFKVSRTDLSAVMNDGGARSSAGLGRTRLKQWLLAAQLGSSCVLLVLTGLMLRSVQRAISDLGFEVEGVAVLTAPLQVHGIKGSEATSYWNALRDAVASNPETEAVALIAGSSFSDASSVIRIPNRPPMPVTEVDPGFFKVMGIPILSGRTFSSSDDFQTTVVISRNLAMEMYGTLDVIGRGFPKDSETRTVIGVAADTRLRKLDQPNSVNVYALLNPATSNRGLIARARNDVHQLLPMMRDAAQSLNDRVLPDARLFSDDFARRTVESRSMSTLLSSLAVLALSLTCVGIFGIVSYAATLRRKELGIRLALGAGRWSVVFELVREVRWPLVGGIGFGLFAGVLFGGVFAGVPLFVKPFDPPVLLAVAAFMILIAGIAALLPAWRALRVDVVESLRCE